MELITFPITIVMQTCYFQHIRSGIGLDIIPIQKWLHSEYIYVFVCQNGIVAYGISLAISKSMLIMVFD